MSADSKSLDQPGAVPGAEEIDDGEIDDELDVEAALLTLAQDLHGPTQDVDLSTLSPTEKRALFAVLRARLGIDGPLPTD
jgi:hypothetical protein